MLQSRRKKEKKLMDGCAYCIVYGNYFHLSPFIIIILFAFFPLVLQDPIDNLVEKQFPFGKV